MPPILALFFCVVFIIGLLYIERNRDVNTSSALWIPFLWMMIILSRFVSDWLYIFGYAETITRETAYYEGSPIDRAVFIILIALGIFVLSRRKITWPQLIKNNKFFFWYFVFCGISIFWSDYSFISLKRWIKELGGVVMVLIIASENEPFNALQSIVRKCAYILVPLSVLFIKYFPEIGRYYNPYTGEVYYHGVTIGKNGLGTLCLVCGFFFVIEIFRWRGNEITTLRHIDKAAIILILSMVLWLLYMSHSATPTATLILGSLMLYSCRNSSIRRIIKNPIFLLVLGSIFAVILLPFDIWRIVLNLLGREETLTGRTLIWQTVFSVKINPFFGVGYESFWLGEVLNLWAGHYSPPNQAHNGYIEIYLNLGYIGLFLIISVLLSSAIKSSRSLGISLYSGSAQLAFIAIFILYNITEYAFRPLHPLWFMFLFFTICPFTHRSIASIHSQDKL